MEPKKLLFKKKVIKGREKKRKEVDEAQNDESITEMDVDQEIKVDYGKKRNFKKVSRPRRTDEIPNTPREPSIGANSLNSPPDSMQVDSNIQGDSNVEVDLNSPADNNTPRESTANEPTPVESTHAESTRAEPIDYKTISNIPDNEDMPIVEDIYGIVDKPQELENVTTTKYVPIRSDPDIFTTKRQMLNKYANEYTDEFNNRDQEDIDRDEMNFDDYDLDIVPEDAMVEDEPLNLLKLSGYAKHGDSMFDREIEPIEGKLHAKEEAVSESVNLDKYNLEISDDEDDTVKITVKTIPSVSEQVSEIEQLVREFELTVRKGEETKENAEMELVNIEKERAELLEGFA